MPDNFRHSFFVWNVHRLRVFKTKCLSMDTKYILQKSYLDILYEGRNKRYGGYQLRSQYRSRISFAALFLFFFLAAGLLHRIVFAGAVKVVATLPVIKTDTLILISQKHDKPEKPIDMPKPKSAPSKSKSVAMTTPTIKEDPEVETKNLLPDKEELVVAVAGPERQEGNSGGDAFTNGKSRDGDATETTEPPVTYSTGQIEQQPEFPGGNDQLAQYISEHLQYPDVARNADKEGKVLVRFVINEDGSVSGAQAVRGFGYGSEEEAIRVISGMPKWKPGKYNGRPVKVWFVIPIGFVLN